MGDDEPPKKAQARDDGIQPLPPVTLDYKNPNPDTPPEPLWSIERNFGLGLFVGVAVSVITWCAGWNVVGESALGAVIGPSSSSLGTAVLWSVPIVKIGVAVGTLFSPRFRGFGIGVLISLPIGALIFFGSCAIHFHL